MFGFFKSKTKNNYDEVLDMISGSGSEVCLHQIIVELRKMAIGGNGDAANFMTKYDHTLKVLQGFDDVVAAAESNQLNGKIDPLTMILFVEFVSECAIAYKCVDRVLKYEMYHALIANDQNIIKLVDYLNLGKSMFSEPLYLEQGEPANQITDMFNIISTILMNKGVSRERISMMRTRALCQMAIGAGMYKSR